VKPIDIKLKGWMKFAHNFGINKHKKKGPLTALSTYDNTKLTIMIKLAIRTTVRRNEHAYVRVDALSGPTVSVSTRVRKTEKSDY
jgi:hypothetical protein